MADEKQDTKREGRDTAAAKQDAGVATVAENARLEHSVDGVTTRDDGLDAGVPMLAGSPEESQGPEDALGEGAKRGDYRNRLGTTEHFESVELEGGGEPVTDDDGNVIDYRPSFGLVAQNPRAEDIGDAEGLKGGVETADVAAPVR